VELIAQDLDATVTYTWWAQRRGFIRNSIKADLCDLMPGTPPHLQGMWTTPPYYTSSYVFVTRASEPPVRSFEDPVLAVAKVGVQLVGDDGFNTPPAHELAARGIVSNVRGYSLYSDYARPNPPARIVDAVASGELDVAIAWGPLAGYFAKRAAVPLALNPVEPMGEATGFPMAFGIAMGVRKGDEALGRDIAGALHRHADEIEELLTQFGVPKAEAPPKTEDPR
jgi:mxaJ protein